MSLQGNLTVERMCQLAQVSRASFYRALQQREPAEENMAVRAAIQEIALEHRRRYGSRRITQELRRRGWRVNRKRVVRIMQEDNLLGLPARRFVFTTDSDHDFEVYLNLARRMQLTGINQLWVADITYVRLQREFVFCAVILDVFSRRVVGWALDRTIRTPLVVTALEKALASRQPPPGLVHHSDRGVQYACAAYVQLLQRHQMIPSMSRPGNPYDNAFCESFMKTLKREEIYANVYQDLEDLQVHIEVFIEQYYNRQRLHSALGYLSPEEFEARQQQASSVDARLGAKVSFFRHGEISPSDGQNLGSHRITAAPQLIGVDESPAGYSLASCSPAELASASPAGNHPYRAR
jgi:transposase InsO family protein